MTSLLHSLIELEGQADNLEETGEREAQAIHAEARSTAQAIHQEIEGKGKTEADRILAESSSRRESARATASRDLEEILAALRQTGEKARPRVLADLLKRLMDHR